MASSNFTSGITLNLHFLVFLYLVAMACTAVFAGACMEYRRQGVVRSYLAMMILYICWLAGNLFLLLSPDPAQKEIYAHLRIIFLALIPPFWVYFTRELFRAPGKKNISKYFSLLFVVPILIIAFSVIMGPSDYLFRNIQPFTALGIETLRWNAGPVLIVHLIYSYSLLIWSSYYCIKGLKYQKGLKPRYSFLLLFSLALFMSVEVLGYFFIPELRFLGIPALTQVLSSMAFYYILHRQQVVRSFSQENHILFESLPTPVILVDRHEEVVLYNSRARDLFSFNLSSVGLKVLDILPEQMTRDLPPLDSIGQGFIVSLNANPLELQLARYFEVISEVFGNDSLYSGGRLLIFNEVTELKRTTQANQRLMSLMSHDLLGNLSSLEVLSRNKSDTHWGLIGDTARSSVDLLKNLLLWSSTQGSLYQPNRAMLSVKQLIHSCLQPFHSVAESRKIHLNLVAGPEDLQINVDAKMFAAILRNILSNAIKYAPAQTAIDIDYIKTEQNTLIRVRDRGPGIDKAVLKGIFALGGDKPLAPESYSEGYGIGLFIILHFLKLHGGNLEIVSLPSGGCLVTAIFPS